MISKTRLLFYSLFCPNKHIPKVSIKPLWYHKCLLILVRRYESFSAVPPVISYYDWLQTKRAGAKLRKWILVTVFYTSWIAFIVRMVRQKKERVNKKVDEMIAEGKPFYPPYDPFKSNPHYDIATFDESLKPSDLFKQRNDEFVKFGESTVDSKWIQSVTEEQTVKELYEKTMNQN